LCRRRRLDKSRGRIKVNIETGIKTKVNFKGSGRGRPLYTGYLDSQGQQVPPLHRRFRSGSGRNDKFYFSLRFGFGRNDKLLRRRLRFGSAGMTNVRRAGLQAGHGGTAVFVVGRIRRGEGQGFLAIVFRTSVRAVLAFVADQSEDEQSRER
jgi:hypothetical protein